MSPWQMFAYEWWRFNIEPGMFEIGPLCFFRSDRHALIVCWKRVVKWERLRLAASVASKIRDGK